MIIASINIRVSLNGKFSKQIRKGSFVERCHVCCMRKNFEHVFGVGTFETHSILKIYKMVKDYC